MTASWHRCLAAASAGLLLAACNIRVLPPTVELTGVRFAAMGLRGATLIAELSIDNPNDFTIVTDSITFAFEAAGSSAPGTWTRVTSGTNTQRVRVEKGTRTIAEIPIEFAYSALSTPVRSLIDRGTFSYRVSGEVFVRRPLRRTVPFSRTGSLSLVARR